MRKIEFVFKNGVSSINGKLENDKSNEDILSEIWNSDEIYMSDTNSNVSFRTEDILYIVIDNIKD